MRILDGLQKIIFSLTLKIFLYSGAAAMGARFLVQQGLGVSASCHAAGSALLAPSAASRHLS